MRTQENRRKQVEVMAEHALAKRVYATKLMSEAEEELIEARLLLDDIEREEKEHGTVRRYR